MNGHQSPRPTTPNSLCVPYVFEPPPTSRLGRIEDRFDDRPDAVGDREGTESDGRHRGRGEGAEPQILQAGGRRAAGQSYGVQGGAEEVRGGCKEPEQLAVCASELHEFATGYLQDGTELVCSGELLRRPGRSPGELRANQKVDR